MKTRIFLFFNIEEPLWPAVRKLFEDGERHKTLLSEPHTRPLFSSYCAVVLDATDPRLDHLRAALSRAGVEWSERREHIYNMTELLASPLLQIIVRTAERGDLGPKYGTEYDMSHACPLCGTGAIQTSPLYLKPSEIPGKGTIFQTYDHEKLVSLEVANALKSAGVSGIELRPSRSYKAHVDLPWVQLLAHEQLPPMSPTSRGILRENPCPLCGRDGYFGSAHEPSEIEYSADQVAIDSLPDAVYTYEYFGKSRLEVPFTKSYFARPLLLVKPKVFEVLLQQKVRGVEFVPVSIIGAQ